MTRSTSAALGYKDRHVIAHRLRQLADLPLAERHALAQALLCVLIIRIGLWTLPFVSVSAFAARAAALDSRLASVRPNRLAWAVDAAARRVPAASCLTRALVMQMLLTRAGRRAEVVVGVRRDGAKGFESHAWLRHDGQILVGDTGDLDRFAPLLSLSAASQ